MICGKLIFSVGSLTEAMRAKKILSSIRVSVVKIDSHKSKNGCSYGIEFLERDMYTVAHLLNQANIEYYLYTTK